MYVDTVEITEEWVALSDLMTVSTDPIYIQNRGGTDGQYGVMLVCEGDTTPEGDIGDIVLPAQRISYLQGEQDLYLRSQQGKIKINITTGK